MNAQIIKTQRAFFSLYDQTKQELKHLDKQHLQILQSEAGDIKGQSRLYSESVAAEIVRTACGELLEEL